MSRNLFKIRNARMSQSTTVQHESFWKIIKTSRFSSFKHDENQKIKKKKKDLNHVNT